MKNILVSRVRNFSWIVVFVFTAFSQASFIPSSDVKRTESVAPPTSLVATMAVAELSRKLSVYDSLDLDKQGLSFEAFERAVKGLQKLIDRGAVKKSSILSIADFSQSSVKKRFYIIDLDNYQLKFRTYVAHGRNSGKDMAYVFSNQMSSNKSSLGFYKTAETYNGAHGYSLRLEGLERGFNDKARERAIVMHAADYVNPSLIKSQGYIGRSLGCPAIPPAVHRQIINEIKGGSTLFVYHPNQTYLAKSSLLN